MHTPNQNTRTISMITGPVKASDNATISKVARANPQAMPAGEVKGTLYSIAAKMCG